MSDQSSAPVAPDQVQTSPSAVKGEAPIPFKAPVNIADTPTGAEPTTIKDCVKINGHGGPKGNRWYYRATGTKTSNPFDATDKVRVCEICGTVDV